MKFALQIAAAFATLALATAAFAQGKAPDLSPGRVDAPPARWISATDTWSIDFASAGWTFIDPIPAGHPNMTLVMVPVEPPAREETRLCIVHERPYRTRDSAETIVQAARAINERQARTFASTVSEDFGAINYAVIDGVTVADFTGFDRAERMHGRHLIFHTPAGGGAAVLVAINCTWPQSLAPEKTAEIAAILESLRIGPGGGT